jgi:dTDP-4-dehydrorhamnose 3,5-epimerase
VKYYNLSEFDGVEILHNESISDDIGVSEIYNLSDWVNGDLQHLKSRFFYTKNFKKGTIRGLHGQVHSDDEHKFIKCISGSIFEVLIDCRRNSPSFGEIGSQFFTANTQSIVHVPPGFLHGYQTLEDNTFVLYYLTGNFNSNSNFKVNPLDKKLNIKWPIPLALMSKNDFLSETFDKLNL